MAEVAIPRHMFQEILRLIAELRPSLRLRRPEAFDGHALKSNGREKCVQMRGKMARSADHPPFPTVHVAAAVRATACLAKTPENRENSHWFGGSYGESRGHTFESCRVMR
jgi:hypothetical protein